MITSHRLASLARAVIYGAAVFAVAASMYDGCRKGHAATLTVRGTAPASDNAGTCTSPTLITASPGAVVTVHVSAIGPVTFEDSAAVAAGSPFTLSRQVPAGIYTVRAWATDSGGIGCDTALTVRLKNPPWKVRL